jgi:predicted SAM-dependent methyltransferase
MVPRWAKASYFAFLSPLMRANSWRHRNNSRPRDGPIRVHLGPGQKNYLRGWINVDANLISCRPDVWADLRYSLPFPNRSVDCVYSHHVIEHLPDLDFHFAEMYRCLKPGGVIRIAGPHGENAMRALQKGLAEWFDDWPTKRRSIGGRFENFIFCRGEHVTILTPSFLRELAEDAGFGDIAEASPGQTLHPRLFTADAMSSEWNDWPDLPKTVVLEAVKPRELDATARKG